MTSKSGATCNEHTAWVIKINMYACMPSAKNKVKKKASVFWRLMDLARGKESLVSLQITRLDFKGTKQNQQSSWFSMYYSETK